MWPMHQSMHVEVIGQPVRVGSLHLSHESPESNSGHDAWQQAFLVAESSHWPSCQIDGETEVLKKLTIYGV